MPNNSDFTVLTADIVAAHVANNHVAVGDLQTLIKQVHGALSSLGQGDQEPEQKNPAVSVRASVKPDYIVCLECGAKQKTLRRHLKSAHNMTPEQYRNDYGLPSSYPMTAPSYSEKRREMAKSIGLGRKGGSGGRKGKAKTQANGKAKKAAKAA